MGGREEEYSSRAVEGFPVGGGGDVSVRVSPVCASLLSKPLSLAADEVKT